MESQHTGKKIGCVGHDCDDCAKQQAEIERLRAELAKETEAKVRAIGVAADLTAENEALRRDAERYRWIERELVVTDDDAYSICWSISCAPALETFGDVIDAMNVGEK